ncbi:hypothetical protein JW998_16120 [candidate division KSB1 bacterium]|nr:hypothetical protein [candidate division KSB1 bacterium]
MKIGMCHLQMQDVAGTKRYFDVLIEHFPETEEVVIAKRQLAQLPAFMK